MGFFLYVENYAQQKNVQKHQYSVETKHLYSSPQLNVAQQTQLQLCEPKVCSLSDTVNGRDSFNRYAPNKLFN